MTIAQREQRLLAEFNQLENWEARYKKIIEMGRALPAMPEEFKTEDLKVRGCQSQVWLKASLNEQKQIVFMADSDALIVKGLIALLLQIFSLATPEEILATNADFLTALGLQSHLSPSRANGVVSMIKQIKYYAAAFQALLSR